MKHVHLPGLDSKVAYARFLHDPSEVPRGEPESSSGGHHTATPGLPDALTPATADPVSAGGGAGDRADPALIRPPGASDS